LKEDLKRQQKELKKSQKEESKEIKKQRVTTLPSDIESVYIDGNNLIFVLQIVRSLALKKNLSEAESALQLIAQEWSKTVNFPVTLIFDDTNKNINNEKFRVCSAKPLFPTSDAALISWAKHLMPDKAIKTLVFTSDRQLSQELGKSNIQVLKSKCFFEIVGPILGKQPEESIDNWATRWLIGKINK